MPRETPTTAWIIIASLWLAACSNPTDATKDNFSKVVSDYLSSTGAQCTMRFDFPIKSTSSRQKWAALVDATLVSVASKTDKKDSMFGLVTTTYELTEQGKAAYTKGKGFCYGARHLVSIDSFTPPTSSGPLTMSEITYQYQFSDMPEWTHNTSIQAAFPKIKAATKSGEIPIKGKKILLLNSEGWATE